jgi:hypothetical protein
MQACVSLLLVGADGERISTGLRADGSSRVSVGSNATSAVAAAGQLQGLLRAGESSDYFADADGERVTAGQWSYLPMPADHYVLGLHYPCPHALCAHCYQENVWHTDIQ